MIIFYNILLLILFFTHPVQTPQNPDIDLFFPQMINPKRNRILEIFNQTLSPKKTTNPDSKSQDITVGGFIVLCVCLIPLPPHRYSMLY